MAERKRIGLREVRTLGENEDVWDLTVPGFGARRQRSEAVAYVLLYRTAEGRSRRFTIGRHGAQAAGASRMTTPASSRAAADPAGRHEEGQHHQHRPQPHHRPH